MKCIREIFRPRNAARPLPLIVTVAILMFSTGHGLAQEASVGARVGTLGLGVEVAVRSSTPVGARLGLNYITLPFEGEADDIDYDFDVNLNSARWVTRAFLPAMLEREAGKIIFISRMRRNEAFPAMLDTRWRKRA